MSIKCSRNRSIYAAAAFLAAFGMSGSSVWAQKPEVQRLFQSGSYEQAVEAAQNGDPATTYLAAQSLLRLERLDRASAEVSRLKGSDQPGWRLVGESTEALMQNNGGRAVELARATVVADGGNPFAQFLLGMSASNVSDWGTAVSAFTKAVELKPDFAYAHYYAALAYQRQRNLPKTAQHFDAFLRLAPDAPERGAVMAILRTIK